MTYKQILLCIAFLLLMIGTAKAGLYEDAVEAYDKGEYQRAALLFEILAERGDPRSQNFLGIMHSNGIGVNKNYIDAAKWFSLAAEHGSPAAQGELGMLYMEGKGVLQNFKIGLWYLVKAIEWGYPPAMGNLGIAYIKGWGVPKDYPRAYMWVNFSLLSYQLIEGNREKSASKEQYEYLIETRNMLVDVLNSDQLDKAQRLAAECIEKKFKNC